MSSRPVPVYITLPLDEELLDQIRQVSPRIHLTSLSGKTADSISSTVWEQAEVLFTDRVLPDPEEAENLRWVQFHFSGIDHIVDHPLLQRRDIDFTTLSGAAAAQMAEYVVAMILAQGHKLTDLHNNQAKAEWPKERWDRFRPLELRGSTVGIIGYGSIGREVARLLQPFGVKILAAKRDAMHPQDKGFTPPGMGDPEGDLFTRLYPVEAVKALLKESDFVVVSLPLTQATRGLIGEAELAAMKPGSYLIDVSRGGIIQQPALITALQEKKLAGAALDVFPEEPLPANNPLWKLPNVIITPHIAGSSAVYNQRAVDLFVENLKRYLAGNPLFNLYNPDLGY